MEVQPHVHTTAQNGHYHYHQDKEALLKRMRRIEGQARGIQRMIEEDRYCPDIVQQISSLTSAAKGVSLLLLQHHIEGCVVDAVRQGQSEAKIRELIGLVRKAIDQRG
jgi:DNA-binding FrmR family transcriptional regulator